MTLLEKYYYENVDVETPKEADNILEILEPIINSDLVMVVYRKEKLLIKKLKFP